MALSLAGTVLLLAGCAGPPSGAPVPSDAPPAVDPAPPAPPEPIDPGECLVGTWSRDNARQGEVKATSFEARYPGAMVTSSEIQGRLGITFAADGTFASSVATSDVTNYETAGIRYITGIGWQGEGSGTWMLSGATVALIDTGPDTNFNTATHTAEGEDLSDSVFPFMDFWTGSGVLDCALGELVLTVVEADLPQAMLLTR